MDGPFVKVEFDRIWKFQIFHFFDFTLCKGIVFFFLHGKVRFLAFLRNIEWMNKKAVFFFFPGCVFFFPPKNLNEWMACELFQEKKKHKKTHQNPGKKKTQPTFIKKNRNPSKIRMNDRWTFPGKKKNTCLCFFFPVFYASRKKKKHDFRIWMNEWPTSMAAEKKKYDTFGWILL